jgi:hypothetical protein
VPGEKKKSVAQAPLVPARGTARNLADQQEPVRNYGPRGIAGLLAPVTRPAFRRRAPAAAQLLADWPQLAGPELSLRAAPVKFAGGTLNLGLGHNMVERLRFVQQSPRLPSPPPARPAPRNVALPEDLPPGELGDALARLYHGLKTRG